MAELNRALLVALAREVATELADLHRRGWELHPPLAGAGFRAIKAGPPDVEITEIRTDQGVQLQLQIGDQSHPGVDGLPASLLESLGEELLDEIRRIERLFCQRLN